MIVGPLLLSAALLTAPPAPLSWGLYGDDAGVEVLRVYLEAVNEEALGEDRRDEWNALIDRIALTYPDAGPRDRARLIVAVMGFADVESLRFFHGTWARLGPDLVTVESVLYPDTGSIYRLTDRRTGEYVGVLTLQHNLELPGLIRELLETGAVEALEAHREELERANRETEVIVEVNGDRRYLDRGATRQDLTAAVRELLPRLTPGAMARIVRVLRIEQAARDDPASRKPPPPKPPFKVGDLELSVITPSSNLERRAGSRLPQLELPDADRLAPFVTGGRLALPDLGLGFERQVRAIW